VPYVLGQAGRLRQGVAALAGNHVTIALAGTGVVPVLAHLQRGSIEVRLGERTTTGRRIARCGNSGNSTEPYLHLQLMDDPDPTVARGVPMTFRRFRETPRGRGSLRDRQSGVPGEGCIVEPLP
jgi:murein DD-endopeptidase MepM/ murein hydrolase activator NlpD